MSRPGPVSWEERAAFLYTLARRFAEAPDLGGGVVGVRVTRDELRRGLAYLDDELDPAGTMRHLFSRALRRLSAELN